MTAHGARLVPSAGMSTEAPPRIAGGKARDYGRELVAEDEDEVADGGIASAAGRFGRRPYPVHCLKAPQIEKYPEIHALAHKIMRAGAPWKQDLDRECVAAAWSMCRTYSAVFQP